VSRVAVVTGAARGIGAATVDALVADGYKVVAVDRCRDIPDVPYAMATPVDLDALANRHGDSVLPVVGDVRSSGDMALAVATAIDHFGRLDALVAVAGVIAGGGPLWEMSDGAFDAVWSVSVLGTRRLIDAGVPAMLRAGHGDGRIVAVSSAAGVLGLRHLAAYSAAKHAVIGLIRGVAMDLAETGVTANVVCPGSTRTAILSASAALYGLDGPEAFVEQQPTGRLLEPNEPAALIKWLCSSESSGVTGAVLAADGGMSVR
jgi:SDR family mycofactocin-dependent oxidoreductase